MDHLVSTLKYINQYFEGLFHISLFVTGKLGQAIRMTDEADTTYVVRFDT